MFINYWFKLRNIEGEEKAMIMKKDYFMLNCYKNWTNRTKNGYYDLIEVRDLHISMLEEAKQTSKREVMLKYRELI